MGREEAAITALLVSMKSGLRDRSNIVDALITELRETTVSMKSGLRDRNNCVQKRFPTRPGGVSMKSGLRDRNNGGELEVNTKSISLSQ